MLIEPRVRVVVIAHLAVSDDRVAPSARLAEDLGVDSLAAIELALALEDEFDIALPDESLTDLHTYADVVQAVGERVRH